MVDWAAVRERMRARREAELAAMGPEEREAEIRRVALIEEREARAAATEAPIIGHFERERWAREAPAPVRRLPMAFGLRALPAPGQARARPGADLPLRRELVRSWDGELTVRIEGRENGDGSEREVIRFVGGPTGHEAYTLDEGFVRLLMDPAERAARPRWYVCGGTPDRWDACWVEPAAIEAYLRERRPGLFADAAPAPGAPGR